MSESPFVRSLRESLNADARVYCTITEKLTAHRGFAPLAEALRQLFDAELHYALSELLRVKATLNKDIRVRSALEANITVFKESAKLAAVALVERVAASVLCAESVERALVRLGGRRPAIESIAEVDEDNLSDTLSRAFQSDRAVEELQNRTGNDWGLRAAIELRKKDPRGRSPHSLERTELGPRAAALRAAPRAFEEVAQGRARQLPTALRRKAEYGDESECGEAQMRAFAKVRREESAHGRERRGDARPSPTRVRDK